MCGVFLIIKFAYENPFFLSITFGKSRVQETVCGFFLFIFIDDEFPNVSRETFMFFLEMVFSFYTKNGIINK